MNADTLSIPSSIQGSAGPAPARDQPDYLAGALLQSLMRPVADPYAPRLVRTLVMAIGSLGVIPLVTLPSKLREFAARERDQLWHLAQWMRAQFGADADGLDPRTPALDHAVHVLRLISWAGALVATGSIVWFLAVQGDVEALIRASYGYFTSLRWGYDDAAETFFPIWMASLCIGYAAQWSAVQVHQVRVRRFVELFNELAMKRRLRPVPPRREVLGMLPVWLIAGVFFLKFGVLWGVPMVLAGAAQTRYIRRSSRGTRQELAQRVRDVLQTKFPAMQLAVPVMLRRKCPVNLCQAPLPQSAIFCPRCGMRVAAVDRVA